MCVWLKFDEVKAKRPLYRTRVGPRVTGGLGSQDFQSALESGSVVVLCTGRFYPKEIFLDFRP